MALIKCPECGKDISDKSSNCIHCGYPLNQKNITITKGTITHTKKKNKFYFAIIAIIVIVIVSILFIGKYTEKKEQQAQIEAEQLALEEERLALEAAQKSYQAMLDVSLNNILPYVEYIGQQYEAGIKISLPSELYDNIEDVEFMGIKGKIDFGTEEYSEYGDYYVRYCSWTSHDGFSEEEFQALSADLNNYFEAEADFDSKKYSKGQTYRYYWIDPHTGVFVTYGHGLYAYHPDGSIEIMWATDYCKGADFF